MAIVRADPSSIAEAARLLRDGQLVAFPTETVYGLGANALDESAVRRIFEAKGRPSYNPLIVHVRGVDDAKRITARWPPSAQRLADRFWPGPLTLVLPKHSRVPDVVTAALPSVAVRVPAHPVALALLRAAAVPVAAPSANRSTEVSPTTAQHVDNSLGKRVTLILDGGPTDVGIESTVVDLSGDVPALLRPGVISVGDLAPFVGVVARERAEPRGDVPRPAPGMLERHYAPRATLLVYESDEGEDRERAWQRGREETARGGSVGALVRDAALAPDAHHVIVMPKSPGAYARRLYAALHELDARGCTLILAESVPGGEAWLAVADRLKRGSA